jgi:hypothetical protein
MSCYSDSYSEKQKKKEVFAHYEYIKNKKCCTEDSCYKLAHEYQDLQYKCDDTFREMHQGELDEKGLSKGTLCEDIKKTKNRLLNSLENSRGGKKSKRKTKQRRLKKRKTRKH